MKITTKYKLQKQARYTLKSIWQLFILGCTCLVIYFVWDFADSHNKPRMTWLIPLIMLSGLFAMFPRIFMPPYYIYYKGKFRAIFPRTIPERTPEIIQRDENYQAASVAFQNRVYEKVVELLEPYQKELPPLLKEKFKYARNKIIAGYDCRLNQIQQHKNNH